MSRIGMIHELHALREHATKQTKWNDDQSRINFSVLDALKQLEQRIEALEAKRTPGRPKKDE